jgi:hypothetical protein
MGSTAAMRPPVPMNEYLSRYFGMAIEQLLSSRRMGRSAVDCRRLDVGNSPPWIGA